MARLNISQDGTKKTEKRNLNFVAGDNIDITITDGEQDDAAEIRVDSTAGAGGHTIQDDDTSKTARTNLSFQDGFVVTDDAGGDQTEVDLSYEATPSTQDYSDAPAGGTAITVARGDHKHGFPAAGSGAPADADYLVGTANGSLSAEIVVGTTPGGELGGTWASPTVDATHSGSAHHTQSHDHSAAGDGQTLTPVTLNIPNAAAPAPTTEGQVAWDNDGNFLVVGDGATTQTFYPVVDATSDPVASSTTAADGTEATVARKDHRHAYGNIAGVDFLVGTATGELSAEIAVGTAPGGELGGTWASPTVDATHAGSTHSAATDTHIADTTDAHDASAISIADAGNDFTATDVEGALDELQADNEAHVAAADPHTGYRLESADHTHQSTGAQAGTLDHGAALTGLTDDDHTQYRLESRPVHWGTFSKEGNLSTGTGTVRLYNDSGVSFTVVEVRASVGTAPASTDIIVDIHNNGTTIMSGTKVVIAAAANTGTQTSFSDTTIADGEYVTCDIDQVGTGTVGADLSVSIWVTHT